MKCHYTSIKARSYRAGWERGTIKHEGTFGPESRHRLHVYKTHSTILNVRVSGRRRNSNFKSELSIDLASSVSMMRPLFDI